MKDEEVVVQQMGDVVVLTLHGSCGAGTVNELETRCREAILGHARHILIDCKHLTHLSSAAMRCLLNQSSEAEKAGICLVLYDLSSDHTTLIQNAGLLPVLQIKKSFIEAYQHCRASTV